METCVGCGAAVEQIEGAVHRYMTSAPGCWARYGELLGVLSIEPSLQWARVMCVDAYAAQHPGTPNPQAIQSVAVHLINIYGYLVRKRHVAIPKVVGHKGAFHWLNPPSFAAARTVFDVPLDATGDAMTSAARAWAESVWTAWSAHHGQIEGWFTAYASS